MKKRNRILALLLAAMLLLSLCACGTAAKTQQEVPTASEAEAVPVPEAAASDASAEAPQEAPETAVPTEIPEDFLSSEPYIPENLEKAIIGRDDREAVMPGDYPYSCVAWMFMDFECGCKTSGTGFMISRYGLLTASHCLCCVKHQKPVKSMDFYFGYRSNKDYLYKTSAWDHCWWGKSSENGQWSADDDYGYVLFSEPVGDRTGWLGWRVLSGQELDKELFVDTGYRDGVIKASVGYMEVLNEKLFAHYMDTEGGYSGGPIFDVEYYAVAINVGEHGNEYNFARRITSNLIENMKSAGLFK